jgi:hypothetical protein
MLQNLPFMHLTAKKLGGDSVMLFCLMFGGLEDLKASSMLGRVFKNQTFLVQSV